MRELVQPRLERRAAAFDKSVEKVWIQALPLRAFREEPDSSFQQRAGRVEVFPLEGGSSPRRQASRGTLRKRGYARVVRVELRAIAGGLLEVVAEDLVLLEQLRVRGEPISEPFYICVFFLP